MGKKNGYSNMPDECFRGLNRQLDTIFNREVPGGQPKYIIQIGADGGALLAYCFQYIKTETSRGNQLTELPLELVALTSKQEAVLSIRADLEDVPHRLIKVGELEAKSVVNALHDVGIVHEEDALYILSFNLGSEFKKHLSSWGAMIGRHGLLSLQWHPPDKKTFSLLKSDLHEGYLEAVRNHQPLALEYADEYLMTAAGSRWVPKAYGSYHYPVDVPLTLFSITHFMHVGYRLRKATFDDLEALDLIEGQCWHTDIRSSKAVIKERIRKFPDGQVVLETAHGIEGVIYSQRIVDEKALKTVNVKEAEQLHDENGSVVHLLQLNILPEKQQTNLGNDLLEFMLQRRAMRAGVKKVVAVTRCGQYPGEAKISMKDYIKKKTKNGQVVDPIIRMHVEHGAKIITEIAGYRPGDKVNSGYGVLVAYDILSRQFLQDQVEQRRVERVLSADSITEEIDDGILELIKSNKKSAYTRDVPLMDLGLESLDLLSLRNHLNNLFQLNLDATFFFKYGTANSVIRYIVDHTLGRYKNWLYKTKWLERSRVMQPQFMLDRLWILFVDNEALYKALEKALRDENQYVVVVKLGKKYRKLDPTNFIINPMQGEHFIRLFSEIPHLAQLEKIVYGWSFSGDFKKKGPSYKDLKQKHEVLFSGVISLLNTVSSLNLSSSPQLIMSSCSMLSDGDSASLVNMALSDLCKVMFEEHPELHARYIVYDRNETEENVATGMLNEICSEGVEPQVMLRAGKRFVPRFMRATLSKIYNVVLSEQATYLITGGVSPLALCLAKWYVSHGARHLVLVDQVSETEESQKEVASLRRHGANVEACTIDFEKKSDWEKVFENIKKKSLPLRGVLHAAGVVDNELLLHMDWKQVMTTYVTKVASGWYLHELTKKLQLQHFVLFSSVLSDLAPLGKSSHALANGFLESLSYYRQSLNLPCLTIRWGVWGRRFVRVKHLTDPFISERMAELQIEQALEALEQVLYDEQPLITLAEPNWQGIFGSISAENMLFDEMAVELGLKRSSLLKDFKEAAQNKQEAIVATYIEQQISHYTRKSIKEFDKLEDLGFDRLLMASLRNRIQHDVEEAVDLPGDFIEKNHRLSALTKALTDTLTKALSGVKTSLPVGRVEVQEPIAIIGMACRFPGGANTPEQYWELLTEGVDVITEVPENRWDIDAYYDANKDAPGKMYTRYGGFIDQVDQFDAPFFGISPREAEDMDPQQRISLEVTWEALENAGIVPSTLKGSNTGVFIGICFNDYGQLITQSGDISAVDNYYSTGNHYSVSAGRISYILGLEGPAMAIDTACSSSLVSIDNAVKHLQWHQCDMAISGGVNCILAPESTINFCKSGMLAEDGRCKTFDEKADGYTRSEGCGMIILKRLSDAQKAGDRILGVIRATAINQDGASTGLTVPSGDSQEKVIHSAVNKAGISTDDVGYVEAHGTGTSLGDPIEVKSIAQTYGKTRSADNPLYLGSVKTNIGHAEAAAGVAGLIKCVLALSHEEIPKHLHYNALNPYIDINEKAIHIVKNKQSWPRKAQPRFAAVSSFGFSGTNSHAIIEEAPASKNESEGLSPPYVLPISGRSEKVVIQHANNMISYLKSHVEADMGRVAYTLQKGRQAFDFRSVVICESREDAIKKLGSLKIISLEELKQSSALVEKKQYKNIKQAAKAWLKGEEVDWGDFYLNLSVQPLGLPTYPFQHERYWAKTAIKSQQHTRDALASKHPILTEKHHLPTGGALYKGSVDVSQHLLFKDHQVFDHIIFPAAGYLELLFAAAKLSNTNNNQCVCLEQVNIEAPLRLEAQHPSVLSVLLSPKEDKTFAARIDREEVLSDKETWHAHVNAMIIPKKAPDTQHIIDMGNVKKACKKQLKPVEFYQESQHLGLNYTSNFQGLTSIQLGKAQGLARIKLHDAHHSGNNQQQYFFAHPVIVDSALQLVAAIAKQQTKGQENAGVYLPIGFEKIQLYADFPDEVYAHASLKGSKVAGLLAADIQIVDLDGHLLCELLGYTAKQVERSAFIQLLTHTGPVRDLCYDLRWLGETQKPSALPDSKSWLLLGDKRGVLEDLKRKLEEQDVSVHLLAWQDSFKEAETFNKRLSKLISNGAFEQIVYAWQPDKLNDTALSTEALQSQQHAALQALLVFVQTLVKKSTALGRLWVITEGAQLLGGDHRIAQSTVVGFVRTLQKEHPEFKATLVDLDPEQTLVQKQADLMCALSDESAEREVAYRHGQRYVPRLYPKDLKALLSDPSYHLTISRKGFLDNLQLKKHAVTPPSPNQVQITVRATGLNFRDVLNAMDMYPGDPGPLGLECSGIVTKVGKKVKGIKAGDSVVSLAQDSFADSVTVDERLVAIYPETLSYVEAATIPLVYLTVHYCLQHCAKLKKGEKILIHAAAGGIGLAAIHWAQHVGAEIYATASLGKWSVLRALGVEHLYDSRTTSFAKEILSQSDGVDVILNALTGEFIEKSVSVLKPKGRFVEIGKRDIWSQEKMKAERDDVRYDIVALDTIMQEDPDTIQKLWKELMPLFEKGKLKPLSHTAFSVTEAVTAFKYMQAAKHIGKVVLTAKPQVSKKPLFAKDATYLITAGLSALGLELAKWMSDQHVKNLVLTVRNGPNEDQQSVLDSLLQKGVNVVLKEADVTSLSELNSVIQYIDEKLPPLKGVFHTAGIVDDGVIQQQSIERFDQVLAPKVLGSYNLHLATKDCALDYFVMYSSIVAILGLAGQSNYAAANCFMDSLMHYRCSQGLVGQSVNWGPWGEVGMAVKQHMNISGIHNLKPEEGQGVLHDVLKADLSSVMIGSIEWPEYLATYLEVPPVLMNLHKEKESVKPKEVQLNITGELENMPVEKRDLALQDYLSGKVRQVLSLRDDQSLPLSRGFFEIGMDSLMAVELRNQLQQDVGSERALSQTLIFNHASVNNLCEYYKKEVYADLWVSQEEDKQEAGEAKIEEEVSDLSVEDVIEKLQSELKDGEA